MVANVQVIDDSNNLLFSATDLNEVSNVRPFHN